eukprot:1142123-Pelagomonas_calceolata.AAC.6
MHAACSSRQGSQNKLDDWDDWGDSPSKASTSNKSLPVSSRVSERQRLNRKAEEAAFVYNASFLHQLLDKPTGAIKGLPCTSK